MTYLSSLIIYVRPFDVFYIRGIYSLGSLNLDVNSGSFDYLIYSTTGLSTIRELFVIASLSVYAIISNAFNSPFWLFVILSRINTYLSCGVLRLCTSLLAIAYDTK